MSASDDDSPGGRSGWHRRQALSDEAAEWFIRLRDDQLSLRQRREAMGWLKQSPDHIAELLRIQQVYSLLRNVGIHPEAAEPQPPVDLAARRAAMAGHAGSPARDAANDEVVEASPLPLPPAAGESPPEAMVDVGQPSNVIELRPMHRPWVNERIDVPQPRAPRAAPSPVRARQRLAATAACLMLAVMVGFFVKATVLDRTLRVALGEWREVTLQDGTQVRAGPGSVLKFSFGDEHRTVRLVSGEAMFDVAKDPARPFFVQSEVVGVLAVGTAFRVTQLEGEDVVTVSEGTVAVYREGGEVQPARIDLPALEAAARAAAEQAPEPEAQAPRLFPQAPVAPPVAQPAVLRAAVPVHAGEQVSVARMASAPVALEKVNVEHERAWAAGWLTYQDMTIGEVVSEFNRRNRVKIVVDDPRVAEHRLAFFRGQATDPESFTSALTAASGVKVVRESPTQLRLLARVSPTGELLPP